MDTSFLDKLDAQNFGPNDSKVASSINHPLTALAKIAEWLNTRVKLASNPNVPDALKVSATADLAGGAQLGAFPFAPQSAGGTLGTLKYKTDLAEGMTKLKDKDIKELIRMILPFDRKIMPTGLTQYINPLDTSEHYLLDFSDPAHAIIKNAYSGESKGNGTLNKKLYAMLANEGFLNHNANKLTKPDKISIMNIVEPNTKLGILNGKTDADGNILPEELFTTLWGKTPKRLGERFGGEAQPISMGSSDRHSTLGKAMKLGFKPHNLGSAQDYLDFFEKQYYIDLDTPRIKFPEDLWNDVDFHSIIKYPK